mmetsp:Transcript_17821/g.32210  ORF Transcript_17821/g.32210 Transcript_17821/m.32210 type:complete len:222 (-) Transcript_17821:990-1655(-)
MDLVPRLQSTQYAHGILRRRLTNVNLLESPFKRLILLNMFAIFINGRGTNTPQLSSRQRRLEKIRRIHRSTRSPSPHHRMHLINKQYNILTLLHLIHHLLQPLLELPPITSTGNQRPHIQSHQTTPLQCLGHIPRIHALCEAVRCPRQWQSCPLPARQSNMGWIYDVVREFLDTCVSHRRDRTPHRDALPLPFRSGQRLFCPMSGCSHLPFCHRRRLLPVG